MTGALLPEAFDTIIQIKQIIQIKKVKYILLNKRIQNLNM